MTKQQIDYSKTVIYRISCNDLPEFIYIGSTTEFTKRKYQHKCSSKSSEIKLYTTIRENGGWDNWRMIVVEQYLDCKNKIEQKIREQKWIDDLNANLNMVNAFITEEQAKLNNIKNSEYKKIHRENNRVKINEQKKEYYNEHKEQLIEKSKIYSEDHKEEIKEYKKEWAKQNKEKIKLYKKEYYEKKKIITL
jgi:hypothetical protein